MFSGVMKEASSGQCHGLHLKFEHCLITNPPARVRAEEMEVWSGIPFSTDAGRQVSEDLRKVGDGVAP